MKYMKTYMDRTDPQRLAEMLAMQEANQKINTDYAPIPTMSNAPQYTDPLELMRMRQMALSRQAQGVGRKTYDTVTPMDTRGLA